MTFPDTRLTAIHRLVQSGSNDDWQRFVSDYWGPVFRFCLRRGGQDRTAAEEISAEVFAVLWSQKLLERWQDNRAAKLRTLICAVAKNLIVQRFRARKAMEPLAGEPADDAVDEDCFYTAWAEDLVRRSLDAVAASYRREGQSDYLRVYLGRTSEGLSIREVAESLALPTSSVDHHYRHVRDRLQNELRQQVRAQVVQCCVAGDAEAELAREWETLRSHLQTRGDFGQVLQESFAELNRDDEATLRGRGIRETVLRLSAIRPSLDDAKP